VHAWATETYSSDAKIVVIQHNCFGFNIIGSEKKFGSSLEASRFWGPHNT